MTTTTKTVIKNYRGFRDRQRLSITNDEPSMTIQSEKDTCDINSIMARYYQSGQITHLSKRQGGYGDVSAHTDYQAAIEMVEQANEEFASLPSALRTKLDNDPAKFLQYINDPKNLDEMCEYGLASKHESPTSTNSDGTVVNKEPLRTTEEKT